MMKVNLTLWSCEAEHAPLRMLLLADQPPDIIAATARQMVQLCSIAETYYRVWYALRSICAMEFMAEII